MYTQCRCEMFGQHYNTSDIYHTVERNGFVWIGKVNISHRRKLRRQKVWIFSSATSSLLGWPTLRPKHVAELNIQTFCPCRFSFVTDILFSNPCCWDTIKGEPGNRPRRTHRVNGGTIQLFLNLGTRRGCVVSITPRMPLPPGKTRYPLYRGLDGPRSRYG